MIAPCTAQYDALQAELRKTRAFDREKTVKQTLGLRSTVGAGAKGELVTV